MNRRRITLILLVASIVALVPGAHAQFDLIPPAKTFEEERAQAAEQHEQMVAQSGGLVDDEAMAAYVSRVGQKVVRNSDMPDERFKFTFLNSPVVNAWTVGGGYVYITRGMLSIMNSEAELAAVLGHEVAHVTARHTARRETKARWKQYETGLLLLLTGNPLLAGSKGLFDVAGILSYSRKQESAADRLGFKTIKKAGYDLDGMTNMLSDLQRYVRLESTMAGQDLEHQVPAWLQDHPQTDDRIRRATIDASLAKLTARDQVEDNRQQYLSAIDGVMYGEDPAQGTMRDGVFWHTGMKFAFEVPDGFRIQNTPAAVIGVRGEDLAMIFGGMPWPQDRSLEDYAAQVWADLTSGALGPIDRIEEAQINDLSAAVAVKRVRRGQPVDIKTFLYRFDADTVMHMSFLSLADAPRGVTEMVESMGRSFRRLSDQEAGAFRVRRIQVVEVGQDDTLASLADRMAFDDYQLGRFKALNGIETHEELMNAGRVKIVDWAER